MATRCTITWNSTMKLMSLMKKTLLDSLSFIVFLVLDIFNFALCQAFRVADFVMEGEWGQSRRRRSEHGIRSRIFVSEQGETRIVRCRSGKLEVEEVSETLYSRSWKVDDGFGAASTVTVNSAIVEMLRGKLGGEMRPSPRWSDCDCGVCASWVRSGAEGLFVRSEGSPKTAKEDVLFIHGFISSSVFWTETLFPNFSEGAKSRYRLLAVDLLGFGRSPKPSDSLYTLKEHLDMIDRSVLQAYDVKTFHIVAHSLGCILALALAARHTGSVQSLTLLAPPYHPVPKGAQPTRYVMRKLAPKQVWPLMIFGASVTCCYEHITRTVCLLTCKNHRALESLAKLITRNRMRTYLIEGFFCHTHNAAWHTLHNIIFGSANKLDWYLDAVRDNQKCNVHVFHGRDDDLLPVECSYNVQKRIPRARVNIIDNKDHLSIVVGRQKDFARELEAIWTGPGACS